MTEQTQQQQQQQSEETKQKRYDPRNIFSTYSEIRTTVEGERNVFTFCNFYIKVEKIIDLSGQQLLDGKILHPVNENCEHDPFIFLDPKMQSEIPFSDLPTITLHDQKEFRAWISKFPKLWYRQQKISALLTEITKDLSSRHIKIETKTQDWGWNAEHTAYLTDKFDIQLHTIESKDPYGNVCWEATKNYYGEYELIQNNDEDVEGSVLVYDPEWQNKIHLGFSERSDYIETMHHIKNDLLRMHPCMHRVIAFTFLAPFTSIIRKIFYPMMFIHASTGLGKTRIAHLCACFFGRYEEDNDLMGILSDSRPAIEAVFFFNKDSLNVLDNWKENTMSDVKKNEIMNIIQNASDGHARLYKGSKGYYPRGAMLLTGEELPQDASTIRKMDDIHLTEPVDMEIKDRCYKMKERYSSVMLNYIRWAMRKYGDTIEQYFKTEFESITYLKDPMLKLNLIGYNMFLNYLLHSNVITETEHETMLQAHIETLKTADAEKEKQFDKQTTAQKFIDAIRAGVQGGQLAIKNDEEYNHKYKPIVGQANRDQTEISIYNDAYSLVRSFNREFYDLPKDSDSVYAQISEEFKCGVQKKQVKNSVKHKNERMLVFDRDFLFPLSTNNMPKMNEIAECMDIHIDKANITKQPTPEEYKNLVNQIVMENFPSSDIWKIRHFVENDLTPIITSFFTAKKWKVPL